MCRLAAFPPYFPKDKAIEILDRMEGIKNTDGYGFTYIQNGKFITRKYVLSFSQALKRNLEVLPPDMPINSWVIAHQRAASVGSKSRENSHPFEVGNWSICHNGCFKKHKIARLCLKNVCKIKGDTDSEIAANLINLVGPYEFTMSSEVDFDGVFLCLNLDGHLRAIRTWGDLDMKYIKETDQFILSSEFPFSYNGLEKAERGIYKFDKYGKFVAMNKKPWISNFVTTYYDHESRFASHHVKGYQPGLDNMD